MNRFVSNVTSFLIFFYLFSAWVDLDRQYSASKMLVSKTQTIRPRIKNVHLLPLTADIIKQQPGGGANEKKERMEMKFR